MVVADGDGANPHTVTTAPLVSIAYSPSLSPDGTHVVFEGSDGHLYVASTMGYDVHQITGAPGFDAQPMWSPKGDLILFTRWDTANIPELYTVSPTGGDRQITFGGINAISRSASWSPDGSKIAYLEETNQGNHVVTMNANGSGKTQISPNFPRPFGYATPAWSPDGTRVAFAEQPSKIDVIGIDSQNWSVLIGHTNQEVAWMVWRPSGSGITVGLDTTDFVVPRRTLKVTGSIRSIGDLPASGLSVSVGVTNARIAAIMLAGAACSTGGATATCTAATVPGDTDLPLTLELVPARPGRLSVQLHGTAANDTNHTDDTASAEPTVSACTIIGTDGNDRLVAHGGDFVCGRGGNDTIEARNGKVDTIDGGPGIDTAIVDAFDHVRRVEHVRRPKKQPKH